MKEASNRRLKPIGEQNTKYIYMCIYTYIHGLHRKLKLRRGRSCDPHSLLKMDESTTSIYIHIFHFLTVFTARVPGSRGFGLEMVQSFDLRNEGRRKPSSSWKRACLVQQVRGGHLRIPSPREGRGAQSLNPGGGWWRGGGGGGSALLDGGAVKVGRELRQAGLLGAGLVGEDRVLARRAGGAAGVRVALVQGRGQLQVLLGSHKSHL